VEVNAVSVTWIKFVSLQWHEIDMCPARETVDFYMPDIKSKFLTTCMITDSKMGKVFCLYHLKIKLELS